LDLGDTGLVVLLNVAGRVQHGVLPSILGDVAGLDELEPAGLVVDVNVRN
jgi:hypothetical protein